MSAPRRDPLAGWRARRAARVATVATVATAAGALATAAKAQKTKVVATVATVATGSGQVCSARAASAAGNPEPESPAPGAAPAEPWLVGIARSIAAALAAGAEREADPEGWAVFVRPDGDRLAVAPRIVAELDRAGLLPVLPEPVACSAYAACARPPEWWDATDEPRPGDRCRCGSGRFWTEPGGRGGWRCATCHPPPPGAMEALAWTGDGSSRAATDAGG